MQPNSSKTSSELPQRASGARPSQDSPVPAHLQCSSCSKPLFNGFQTPHGCRLCQPCVTGLLPPVEKRRCPGNTEACRDHSEEIEVSQASCFPDMATRREVARLRLLCPNCDAGCSAALSWALMDQHLDSCDFQTLHCELCGQQVMKKVMQRHTSRECEQRKVRCELCSQLVPFCEMESRHRNLESDACCPRFSAACPHCGDRRAELSRPAYVAHLPECPERPVECKYSHLGCGVRVRRSDLVKHYRDCMDSHLELVDSRLRQAATTQQTSAVAVRQPLAPADSAEVADVNRQVTNVYGKFKGLQANATKWAQSTIELEQLVEKFGGVTQLRNLLSQLEERSRCAEPLQQQVQLLQQQVQQLQLQVQRTPQRNV